MLALNLPRNSFEPFPHILYWIQAEDISTSLFTSHFQEVVEVNEVTPQPHFLQTRQAQNPLVLLTGLSFQPLYQLCCPPLDTFKDPNNMTAIPI